MYTNSNTYTVHSVLWTSEVGFFSSQNKKHYFYNNITQHQ